MDLDTSLMMKRTQEILFDKINDNQSNLKVGYGSDFGYGNGSLG
jgi:hypothetical protein